MKTTGEILVFVRSQFPTVQAINVIRDATGDYIFVSLAFEDIQPKMIYICPDGIEIYAIEKIIEVDGGLFRGTGGMSDHPGNVDGVGP